MSEAGSERQKEVKVLVSISKVLLKQYFKTLLNAAIQLSLLHKLKIKLYNVKSSFFFLGEKNLHFFKAHFLMSSLIMKKKEINYKTSEKYFMNCVRILSN